MILEFSKEFGVCFPAIQRFRGGVKIPRLSANAKAILTCRQVAYRHTIETEKFSIATKPNRLVKVRTSIYSHFGFEVLRWP